jgi:membrane protein implicated in regulation of membrane protease activity
MPSCAAFAVVFVGVEAVARVRMPLFLTVLAVAAVWIGAAASLVYALLHNWQLGPAGLLAVTALVVLALNMRELFGRPGRRRDRPGSATEGRFP